MNAMPTTICTPDTPKSDVKPSPPIVFITWDEAMAYFAVHLKPVAFGPKGQPIYSRKDMDALNVRLPIDY